MTLLEQRSIVLKFSVSVRAARADDLPKLEWYGQYRHFRRVFQRTFRDQQAGRRLMLIAECNHFPIGQIFILFKSPLDGDSERRTYLYSFRVMEMFRGHGLGTQLLREAEAIIVDRGFKWATIAVAKDNTRARRLYERLGYHIFSEDEGHWNYVDHRGLTQHVHEPCWMLEKNLISR